MWLDRRTDGWQFLLAVDPAGLAAFMGVEPLALLLDAPASWTLRARTRRPAVQEGAQQRVRARLRASQKPLSLLLGPPEAAFALGGPSLAVGAALRPAALATRVGYSVSFSSRLVGTLHAETDLEVRLGLSPLVEAVCPQLLILP